MLDISSPFVIAFASAAIIGLFLYVLFADLNEDAYEKISERNTGAMKPFAALSREIYSSLPKGVGISRYKSSNTESLITRSGNPWDVSVEEFNFFRIVSAVLGFIAGWIAYIPVSNVLNIPWYALVVPFSIIGYVMPFIIYRDAASRRDLEFKRQMPEALELMIITLSAGSSFSNALVESIPDMRDGVLKQEFIEISNKIAAGSSVERSLDDFADRAPNDSIKTFVRAVQESLRRGTPTTEVLKARATASREEFFALVYSKTAQLSSRIFTLLTPTLMGALLIVVLAPPMFTLLGALGR